jgi:DNA-binding transcriptional LysR family regulator
MPLTRLFFEPQKTIAISSARENPNRRAARAVQASEQHEPPRGQLMPEAFDGRGAEHGVDHQQHRTAIDEPEHLTAALHEAADPALQCLAGEKRQQQFEHDAAQRTERKTAGRMQVDAAELDLVLAKRRPGDDRGRLVRRETLVWVAGDAALAEPERPLPLILYPPPSTSRAMALEALERAGRRWRIVCTSSSLSGLNAAALAGLGICVQADGYVLLTGLRH